MNGCGWRDRGVDLTKKSGDPNLETSLNKSISELKNTGGGIGGFMYHNDAGTFTSRVGEVFFSGKTKAL